MRTSALTCLFVAAGSLAVADTPVFTFPLDCELGENCHIQQFVDVDPSSGIADYGCGMVAYDGHKGTDFRINNLKQMERGVNVLAAADGVVVATRNFVPDKILENDQDRKAIKGIECGNGLVIRHENGWRTQYCHMKQNSIVVRNGMPVKKGDIVGQVGVSGKTQFPHLHFEVKEGHKFVDPFKYDTVGQTCGYSKEKTLWDSSFLEQYDEELTQVIASGIAPSVLTLGDIQSGKFETVELTSDSTALVVYGMWINLQKNDFVWLKIFGPNGDIAELKDKPIDRQKARYFRFAGKKAPPSGWEKGVYRYQVKVMRNGKIVSESSGEQILE